MFLVLRIHHEIAIITSQFHTRAFSFPRRTRTYWVIRNELFAPLSTATFGRHDEGAVLRKGFMAIYYTFIVRDRTDSFDVFGRLVLEAVFLNGDVGPFSFIG